MSTIIFELTDTAIGWCAALLLAAGWYFVFRYGRNDAKQHSSGNAPQSQNDTSNPSNRSN